MYSNDSYAGKQLYFRMREGYTYDINPWKLLSKKLVIYSITRWILSQDIFSILNIDKAK